MRVNLLYRDREAGRMTEGAYDDAENIIRDLGLKTLFEAAGRRLIIEHGEVKRADKEDPFVVETMRRVMMLPLISGEEIGYRQAVMKDTIRHEDMLRGLYRICCETLRKWDVLGRGTRDTGQQRSPTARLIDGIQTVRLFCDALTEMRELFTRERPGSEKPEYREFTSEGFRGLYERFSETFPEERERVIRRVLDDTLFFTDGTD